MCCGELHNVALVTGNLMGQKTYRHVRLAMYRNTFLITRQFGASLRKWQHKPTRLHYVRFLATRRTPEEPGAEKALLENTNANKEYIVADDNNVHDLEEQSALSRRLEAYTEEALSDNPRFMKAAVANGEFDFNKELKQKILERIASADFSSNNAQALATANLPVRICYPSHDAVWQLT